MMTMTMKLLEVFAPCLENMATTVSLDSLMIVSQQHA